MKKKLLLIAYRAYGDFIFSLPAMMALLKEYDVHLECNLKGWELFHDDPRFSGLSVFCFESFPIEEREHAMHMRRKMIIDDMKPDRVIDINGTLEQYCIAERFQEEFHFERSKRREHFGSRGFYDAVFERCEIPVPPQPQLEGLYFSDEQTKWAEKWIEGHGDQFVMLIPFSGSRSHKVYHEMPELTYAILKKYPDAFIYLAGDRFIKGAAWKHERIRNTCDAPIKQVMLMAKYVDMVLGPETGLMVTAGMWGTPKMMLCTASSVYQCTQYTKNDFSIQAKIPCSPCHRAIEGAQDCETMVYDDKGTALYPACVKKFDADEIMKTVDHVYQNLRRRIPQAV